nr:NAD(P)H-binding protein [Parashewanella hymeniacidonis]
MKTAIVLGATGLIGRNLVAQLANQAEYSKVIAITRRRVEYDFENVSNEVVNFDCLDDFSNIFTGDVLFSCLGTTKKQAGSYEAQRIVDVDYQLKVAQLAAKNKVQHYLLVSSRGANSKSNNPYFQMKGELEEQVIGLNFVRVSIFQPSLLLGERDHFRFGEAIGFYLMPVLKYLPLLKSYRPIEGGEVAEKMVQVSLSSETGKELFKLDEVFPQVL